MTQDTDAPQLECVHNGYHRPGQCPEAKAQQDTDAPQSDYARREAIAKAMGFVSSSSRFRIETLIRAGWTADRIIGGFPPSSRPAVAQYLAQQGEVLRSEFRSQEEAEAFWAHVGEDEAIERAGISGFDMAQVPDPGE